MSYKKHHFLDDIGYLKVELIDNQKSMAQLAGELAKKTGKSKSSLAGCIRQRVLANFSKEEISKMGRDRAFHRNNKL